MLFAGDWPRSRNSERFDACSDIRVFPAWIINRIKVRNFIAIRHLRAVIQEPNGKLVALFGVLTAMSKKNVQNTHTVTDMVEIQAAGDIPISISEYQNKASF